MIRAWIIFCTVVGTLVFGACLSFLLIPPSRDIPAQVLLRSDNPAKGDDAIVLLMGDASDRVPAAAKLYKKGYGKKIVFVEPEMARLMEIGLRPMEGQMVYEYLTKFFKIPPEDIIFNQATRVTSTQEEARALLKLIESQKFKRVIVTTSWYHSSRTAWIFNRLNKGRVVMTHAPTPIPDEWYRSELDFLNVFNEYLKWTYGILRYGFI